MPRVLWKWRPTRSALMPACSSASRRSCTRLGVAIPVVSPKERESASASRRCPAIWATRSGATSPSYGQPNAVDTMASTGTSAPCASSTSSRAPTSDSATLRRTFFRLWVSLADTTSSSSSAFAASASSAPFGFGTSAVYTTPGRRLMRAITSSEPAMGGIASARTNDAASMWRRPVRESASISRTRASIGTGGSFCNPSRGPTSHTSTLPGQSTCGNSVPGPFGASPRTPFVFEDRVGQRVPPLALGSHVLAQAAFGQHAHLLHDPT